MNKNDNEVTNFMYYMYNVWNKIEAVNLFGENLGEHIYDKWLMTGRDKDLLFYSMLDNECRQTLVDRANEYYNK